MNKNLGLIGLFCASVIVLILSSCNSDVVYNNQQSVPDEWKSAAEVQFEFEHLDTISSHQFVLSVRNNTDYKYQNVFFFVKLINPDGGINTDTVECQLADYKGKWLGKGFGKIREVSTVFGSKFVLNQTGTYKLIIEHAMRLAKDEGLRGIEDVGFQLIKN